MNNAYDNFIAEANEAIGEFPELQLCTREDSLPYLVGDIELSSKDNLVYDRYSIRIECPTDYPNSFPYVFETAQRLPHNIDWHVYGDGHFCICTPVEEYIHCAKGISVLSFIKEQVVPYLHNQSFREKEGYFLNERSHGPQGILESLYDLLKTNVPYDAYRQLKFIYDNDTPPRASKCFCNSDKKYRYCHRDAYLALKSMGQERLLELVNYLKRTTNFQSPRS